MTARSLLALCALLLLSPACGPAGGPPDEGGHGGPEGGGPEGGGGPDAGLPELSWTPGEIKDAPVVAQTYVALTVATSAAGFDQDVGTQIGAMYQALESTKVKKTGPAFVVVSDPWGPSMNATIGFPVVSETTSGLLPEGFALQELDAGPGLAMVFQGPRSTLSAADEALFGKAGKTAADGGTRIYVLLDRPDQAGPAGPKTKAVLRL